MEKQFEFNGGVINYQVTGKGKPVVLLHGFGEDSSIWDEQITFLQPHCLLVVPDLPGSGRSTLLQGEGVTIEEYASCIYALLQAESIGNCIMLGHSMGGYITLAFAEKFPEKLTAFGFVHSTAFADNEEKKATRRKAIQFIREHGVYPFLKNSTPSLFSVSFKNKHPDTVTALIEKGREFSTEALIQYYSAMISRPDRTSVLANSQVPVLFVIGSEDVAAPKDDLLKQVHLPKVSFIHILEEVGHMSMWEKPTELNTFLLHFIQEVSESF